MASPFRRRETLPTPQGIPARREVAPEIYKLFTILTVGYVKLNSEKACMYHPPTAFVTLRPLPFVIGSSLRLNQPGDQNRCFVLRFEGTLPLTEREFLFAFMGVKGQQSFSDFCSGFAKKWHHSNTEYRLGEIYLID